ncbi:MAG: hypothetical protein EBY17_18240 [Acidobacteriia bacterium]|nr:hypothetical protein [Terriglobia bacterium]
MSSPFPKDGYLISLPLPSLVLDVQVTIGGKDAKVEYVAGVLQIKVHIPAGVPVGVAELIITAGTAYSPRGVIVSTIDTP